MILDNFFGMLKKCSFENLTRDYRTTKYMNNALAMPSRMRLRLSMSHLWNICLAVGLSFSSQSPTASTRMAGSRLYQNDAVEKSMC